MIQSLVTVDIALELKKIGFDEPCLFIYRNGGIFLEGTASVGFSIDSNEADFVATIEQLWEVSNQEGADWVTVPTYEQVFAWFREKGFECVIESYYDIFLSKRSGYLYYIEVIENDMRVFTYDDDNCFDTYEETRLDALTKLIKLYEEDKK